ncbi:hypothetical protein N9H93_04065 [Rhizobiaceae bacterium]|nr:hypothetical protein [Rhizobiaceae bacterium]
MSHPKPDLFTTDQLASLGYDGGHVSDRPLLACDVDEVVIHLVEPFERVMNERGYELKAHAFKLTGNVFERETGREATMEEVWEGLEQLFGEQAERQGIVDGVADGLAQIAEVADIVFLTNMPHPHRETRAAHLQANGMHYPLVTNSGSKAPALRLLAAGHKGPTGFVDDSPKNHEQVREALPDIRLFHFMANETFRNMLGTIDGALIHAYDWREAAPAIVKALVEER